MADLMGIELARPGTWNLASGKLTVTPQMLDDAARFAARENARPGYLKLGHTDTRFTAGDGEPALGWLGNIRLEEDDQGHVLKGDVTGMPEWLAAAAPTAWPDRSIEGYADYVHDGQTYGLAIDGLALLGVTPPGMTSIRSLRDLPAALGVAASGRRIVASFGDTTSQVNVASISGARTRELLVADARTRPGTQTPAVPAEVPPTRQGAGMDPVMIREALGLSTDASDDEVRSSLTDAGLAPTPAPVAASAGTVVLASSTWEETQKTIKSLTDHVEQTKRNERDDVIGKAVMAGKFTPAQRQHFTAMWDSNPEATRNLINALTPNTALAVAASGYAGEGVEADPEYAALYGPSARQEG